MDQLLPTQLLPAIPHVAFSIFNFAFPTIVAFAVVIIAFFAGSWLRIPGWIAGPHEVAEGREHAPDEGSGRESH